MDHQVDSLNELMTSTLRARPSTMTTAAAATMADNEDEENAHSSPAMPVDGQIPSFHYFLSEQAKSILALQELQNEVGVLLEFRDLVMEAFPQLAQKLSPTFNHTMPSQTTPLSPSKWEPGIRVKRKLGQQLRDPDVLVPSLLPRYRSNSQGKGSRSSEVSGSVTSSAIQDSGFCTESSKDHSSAISSRSKSRETDDELFSLLDHIHNKGTRLKLEVEYLWSELNKRGANSSLAGTNKRRCKSLDDLMTTNGSTHSFTFECAVRTAFLETELQGLKREREMLLKKMSDIESERMVNVAQTNRLLMELETISSEKRELEERLQDALRADEDRNNRTDELSHNFLSRNHWSGVQNPVAKGQLMNLMQVFKNTSSSSSSFGCADQLMSPRFVNSKNTAVTSTPLSKESYYTPDHSQKNYSLTYDKNRVGRPSNPMTKAFDCRQEMSSKSKDRSLGQESLVANTKEIINACRREPSTLTELNGGGSGGHLPRVRPVSHGGVTLTKEKVLSILNEYDPATLHRFLLTLSYEIEALSAHAQRLSKSRLNIFDQMNKFKVENEDLRFQLEEKNIQLEGTKAKVRILERMRNEKFCYSTSDLISTSTKPTRTDAVGRSTSTCPVSDSALLNSEKTAGISPLVCDRVKSTPSSGRRSISKIPLKTSTTSKLSNKFSCSSNSGNLSSSSGSSGGNSKKTLTSFKEYGPPNGSCISYTSSSLSNK